MTPKKKICKSCKKETYIWARGNCKDCDRKENTHKHGLGSKPKTASKIVKNWNKKRKPTGEKALFQALWETRPHVSFVSGKKVEPVASTFSHILPKSVYPSFRLYDKNIVFLTPEEHYAFDMQSEDKQRELAGDWDKLYQLREELLKEYRNGDCD
jgi:hypothetical protein